MDLGEIDYSETVETDVKRTGGIRKRVEMGGIAETDWDSVPRRFRKPSAESSSDSTIAEVPPW